MKQTKKSVDYRPVEQHTRSCHTCVHIVLHGSKPATCEKVQGTVDRTHVCDLWKKGSAPPS